MLVRHTLWVGSSCLYCALEDAPGQPTWPAFAQKGTLFPGGPVLFVSLLETFSHALRQPKCHQTPMFTQLNLTHSETLQSVQKGWEKVSWWHFFDRKFGFYLFLCAIYAFSVGRIPSEDLMVQLALHMHPVRGERNISNQFHSSLSLHWRLLWIIDSCELLPLRKPCITML